jgi:ferredoxin
MLRRDINAPANPCKVSRTPFPMPVMSDSTRPPMVRVEPLGVSFEAPDSLTILEAAGFANLRLPRSCRNGTCRTCLCRMTAGSVRYAIEWPGVSREEKAEGYILPCVAIAESDVVIEVPGAMEVPAR